MARFLLIAGFTLLLAAAGCDNSDRIARLEKQNQELQSEVTKRSAVAEYDLQAKCSKDAREWFNLNWASSRDKDTILLDFTNHYNKKLNKCFILVEYHYNQGKGPSWYNDMTLWNVYENSKYANFAENHFISFAVGVDPNDRVITCDVTGNKCKSLTEFNNQISSYLDE